MWYKKIDQRQVIYLTNPSFVIPISQFAQSYITEIELVEFWNSIITNTRLQLKDGQFKMRESRLTVSVRLMRLS